MSVRPPTLRENRRYLLAWVEPGDLPVDGKELYYVIYEAVTSLFGDVVAAGMRPAVISVENGYIILRCRRGTEREFAIALSTVTSYRDSTIAIRVCATSGTIESLRERMKSITIPESVVPDGQAECTFDHRTFQIVRCQGNKVDVIEKGFKNTHRLLLVTDDLEES